MSPTVAVVIPTYRRLGRLAGLAEEYLRQGADEIVVVLDGPHPGWREAVPEQAGLSVVELPENRGLALARIAGLEAAASDVILAVDDDVVPAPGLVAAHRAFHARRAVTAGAGAPGGADAVLQGYMPVALPPRRGPDDAATYLYARGYLEQVRAWRADPGTVLLSLWGGNLSLPRGLYLRAEAYKPSVRIEYSEDLDLGLRLRDLGAEAVFDETARADHQHSRGLDGFVRECLARGGAIADLEDRWGERPAQLGPLVTIPSDYSRVLGAVQRSIARSDAGGPAQAFVVGVYRVAGALRAFRLQDAAARLLRRALIMRGYRLATEMHPAVTAA